MVQHTIKEALISSTREIEKDIERYCAHPGKDFTRIRKLPALILLLLLVYYRAKSSTNEIADFFRRFSPESSGYAAPTASAVGQQRRKLSWEAWRDLCLNFTDRLTEIRPRNRAERRRKQRAGKPYRLVAVDGTNVSFDNCTGSEADAWRTTQGSSKPYCACQVTALWDVQERIYLDARIQPIHEKDERGALVDMLHGVTTTAGERIIFTGDRGFPSWNVIAELREHKMHFLLRCKDMDQKSSQLFTLALPKTDTFDTWVSVEIVRTLDRQAALNSTYNRILLVSRTSKFDYIELGSKQTYRMELRVVCIRLENGSYEYLLTNLPTTEFPPEVLKQMYARRWGVETGFGMLKDHIALEHVHSRTPELIKQEIWAALTAFNYVSALRKAADAEIEQSDLKYRYEADFSFAVNHCLDFLIRETVPADDLLLKCLAQHRHPVRPERSVARGSPKRPGPQPLNHRPA